MTDNWKSREKGVPFVNQSGETIPPFACMAISGSSLEQNEVVLAVRKPEDADLYLPGAGIFVFNDETEVEDSQGGFAILDPVCHAVGAGIAIRSECGPVSGSWELSSDGSGFWKLADDGDSAANGIVVRQDHGENAVLIYTPGGGVPGRSQKCPPFGFGSALCEVINPLTENVYTPPRFVLCKNIVDESIAPRASGKAEKVGGIYIIDVASCQGC